MNKVKSVSADFINHNRADRRESFTGWDTFLNKYMNKMPTGFTANYIFKCVQGTVTMKHLYTSKEEVTVRLVENMESTGRAMLRKILGTESKEVSVQDICLLIHPVQELKKSKLKSLAKKYGCIPKEYLLYYPQPPEATSSDKETNKDVDRTEGEPSDKGAKKHKASKRKLFDVHTPGVPKKKKRGRPRNAIVLDSNQRSIMTMFRTIAMQNHTVSSENFDENIPGTSTNENGCGLRDEVDI